MAIPQLPSRIRRSGVSGPTASADELEKIAQESHPCLATKLGRRFVLASGFALLASGGFSPNRFRRAGTWLRVVGGMWLRVVRGTWLRVVKVRGCGSLDPPRVTRTQQDEWCDPRVRIRARTCPRQ